MTFPSFLPLHCVPYMKYYGIRLLVDRSFLTLGQHSDCPFLHRFVSCRSSFSLDALCCPYFFSTIFSSSRCIRRRIISAFLFLYHRVKFPPGLLLYVAFIA